ncbi:MAG: hypothetical protein JOS17DRAFT_748855 [Linnemannia elongata]|nr:MAG: hypothetical protein JOS17DRAFT_748855 [Linnemannia elongata]
MTFPKKLAVSLMVLAATVLLLSTANPIGTSPNEASPLVRRQLRPTCGGSCASGVVPCSPGCICTWFIGQCVPAA